MAKHIQQFRGSSEIISLEKKCKIGISIGEKSFMQGRDIYLILTLEKSPSEIFTEKILLGKTFIYEPGDIVKIKTISFSCIKNNVEIIDNIKDILVEVVYLE